MARDSLDDLLATFNTFTKKPATFLSVQDHINNDVKQFIKSMYDFTKLQELDGKDAAANDSALPELIIRDFDEEQIWQEIELQNSSQLEVLLRNVVSAVSSKTKLKFPVEIKSQELAIEDETIETEDDEANFKEDKAVKSLGRHKKKEKKIKIAKKKVKSSVVDDEFFKLNEMEQFLEAEDKKEMSQEKRKRRSNDSDEDSVDLFEESDSEDDNEYNENGIKYKEFFDGPNDDISAHSKVESSSEHGSDSELLGEEEASEDDGTKQLAKKKSVRFNLDDHEMDNNDSVDETTKPKTEPTSDKHTKLSEYEQRQKRLRDKIEKLEEKNLGEKPWQLKGEVGATSRPQNSLLEEVVDFDLTTRPVPIITEETTLKLEDIIKQRIKDKVWDDVERKAKPVPETHEFRKTLILDQEKSKASLAQVYEQEYLKQKHANGDDAVPEEPEEQKHIKKAMENLFAKLDALSNYHYTPKVAQAEVKIVSNIPAISMEEVAPVATSDAALLAPEEVKGKRKGELMNKSERTTTDKKRERRKKKKLQRERENEKEKKEKLLNKLKPGLGNKYSKEKAAKLLDKVTNDFKNTDKMTQLNDVKALKSSKAFFTQLNDDMGSSIKTKSKKNKTVLPAKKYKL